MRSSLMGRLNRLGGGAHREAQDLLPWYLSGTLDAAEQAKVEAHLGVCAECRADLAFQARLKAEAPRPLGDVEQGWSQMLRKLEDQPQPRVERRKPQARRPGLGGAWSLAPAWGGPAIWSGGGALAGAALTAVAVIALSAQTAKPPAAYHALGAKPAASPGNLAVIFRPDTPEQRLREIVQSIHARVVDGPTPADAYVLSVPAARRAAALVALRLHPEVTLAQPLDPDSGR